jgi:hypothetical protein
MPFTPVPKVARERYNRHPRTLERWSKDPKLNFPQFKTINGRNYLDDAELDRFDRDCTRRLASELPPKVRTSPLEST